MGKATKEKAVKKNPRAVAVDIVAKWLDSGKFPDRMVEDIAEDRAFVMEVVYGVARWRGALEWTIRRISAGKADERAVPYLFGGLYQILFMDTVAAYAAVNETVNAVKTGRASRLAGFVNALLRRAAREKTKLLENLSKQDLAIKESHPPLLVKRWLERFGEKRAEALCKWNNTRPSVVLRPNKTRMSVEAFAGAQNLSGIAVKPHKGAPDFLVLPRGVKVEDVPGYEDGLFSVQDPSTARSIDLLAPQAGEFVLDACAAPGGKTAMIAERMDDKGTVVAVDVHESRLDVIRENTKRLEYKSVRMCKGDSADPAFLAALAGDRKFDRILLDVPCSNTGVLRRRPDARWRFSMEQLAGATGLQKRLLDAAAKVLKPGGVLVYSTCSLESEEDEGMIESWLAQHKDFELEENVLLFPPEVEMDGAYAAKMKRKS